MEMPRAPPRWLLWLLWRQGAELQGSAGRPSTAGGALSAKQPTFPFFSPTQVTFLNEVTEEYLFYMVTFKATAPGPVGTVEVSATVRQSVSSAIRVDNPLAIPVVFDVDCKVPELSVPPHFSVPARAEVGAQPTQLHHSPSGRETGLFSEGGSSH